MCLCYFVEIELKEQSLLLLFKNLNVTNDDHFTEINLNLRTYGVCLNFANFKIYLANRKLWNLQYLTENINGASTMSQKAK